MKVLQIVKTNDGASWAFSQAKWLYENGIDIVTVLPSIEGGVAEKYKQSGMSIVEGDFTLPVVKPWRIFKKNKEINSLVNKVKPDIIHCHFVTNIMMLRIALRKSNIPRFFQVPGPLHLESKIFKRAEIILSTKRDYWGGACKKTCDMYLEDGLPKNRVFLSYYGGYGGDACDQYRESTGKLHTEYQIPSNKILIGMVSYFYKPKAHLLQKRGLKGHEDFIDAIALVRRKNPNVVGVIMGSAWGKSQKYEEKVKKYAKKRCEDEIIFTGFRNDLKEVYRELDVVVHPSHSENLGGAAESLAAGVPTISTNIGGFPDIVIDEKTGYTVSPKSSRELAGIIIKVTEDLEKSNIMAEIGRDNVRELLDIKSTSSKVFEIYETILKG